MPDSERTAALSVNQCLTGASAWSDPSYLFYICLLMCVGGLLVSGYVCGDQRTTGRLGFLL